MDWKKINEEEKSYFAWKQYLKGKIINDFKSEDNYNKFIDILHEGLKDIEYQEAISKLPFVYENEDKMLEEEINFFLKEKEKKLFNRRQF